MLIVSDFGTPLFDRQPFRRHKVGGRPCIEGVTITNGLHKVSITYFQDDNELLVMSEYNERLYKGHASSPEEFEKRLKYIDRKLRKRSGW